MQRCDPLKFLLLTPVYLLGAAFAVPVLWMVGFVLVAGAAILSNGGHQSFARNGLAQIQPAQEMANQFADCRRFVTYGANNVPQFNSVAYFGGRYELAMQVDVVIYSAWFGRMTGPPRFYLHEVEAVEVSRSGQTGATFSRDFRFGAAEWRKVYDAGGDFGVIGFKIDPTPVRDFEKFAAGCRPSNE